MEKKQLEKAQLQNEKIYSNFFKTSVDPVFITSREGRLIDFNDSTLDLFGYGTRDELLKIKIPQQYEDPEDREKIIQKIEQQGFVGEFPVNLRKKDGSIINTLITSVAITNEKNNIIGYQGTIRNITELKKTQEELKKQFDHINLINHILRHDILNNLTATHSALRLYKNNKKEEYLQKAFNSINKSIETINRMRELELFISSHHDLRPYSVIDVLENVIKSYPSITFNIENECQVMANDFIYSTLDNIISNAIIHGKTDTIDIKIEGDARFCKISIADHGIGIPDEIKEKIFDKDFTYGETGKTGMGLYLVKKTMQNYGGYVLVEDNIPKGTVFILALRKVR